MSSYEALIRYDGPILADHKMDVEHIAPAMLALSNLCKRANELASDGRARVQVFVKLDVEQHCVEFKIEVLKTIYEHVKGLIDLEDVVTAKTIIEWLMIGSGPVIGLFTLLRMLGGRKPDSISMVVKDGRDVTQIVAGGDVFLVHPITAQLLADPRALNDAKSVVRPAELEGYEKVEFEDRGRIAETITKQDAILIEATPLIGESPPPSNIIPAANLSAKVKIRKAVYEGTGKWTVLYDKVRDMAITDTGWLADFQANREQAPPGSWLKVDIQISAIKLDSNDRQIEEPTYTITKVHGVDPPHSQGDMFDKK